MDEFIEYPNNVRIPFLNDFTNGLFTVALLAILIDHLKSFQEGEFATREAAIAITDLEKALWALCARADERAARGVLGAHAK